MWDNILGQAMDIGGGVLEAELKAKTPQTTERKEGENLVATVPAKPTITKKQMMIAGGAVIAVVAIVVLMKRK